MNKRINVILPEQTLEVLDGLAGKGRRSQFISRAVLHYVKVEGKKNMEQQLKAGYKANADEALKMAQDWFPLEEEVWQKKFSAISRRKNCKVLAN